MKKSSNEGAPSVKEYYRSKENREAIKGILEDPATKKLVEKEMTPEEIALALKYLDEGDSGEDSDEEKFHQLEKLIFITYEILGTVDIPATMPKRVVGQSAKKPEQK